MKKFLSLVVAALLSASAVATNVSAAKFTDVDVNNAALNDAVELLTALDVTKGTTDTTFGTEENVTRQQMAAFIYRMMKAGKSVEGGVNTTSFTDLDDSTYYFMVSWANSQGIIKGRSATTFDPKGGITLQDAYTMVIRALGYDDGTLTYPIGYISKAEDLGLDKDLPSALNYTDTLKRGDVAIILANMFYAETSEVEIKYVSNFIQVCGNHLNGCEGKTTPHDQTTISIESTGSVPKEYHKTVAEAVFDVKQIRQRVIATPSYALKTNSNVEQIEEDVPMIQLSTKDVIGYGDYFEAGETPIESLGQREFAEFGLEGNADDYFLNDIVMFVRVVDGEVKIFGATAIGSMKTVSFDDVEFGTVNGTTKDKYYDKNKEYKKINGKLTLDGTVTYLFDAPYTFTKGKDLYTPNFITLGKFNGDIEEEKLYKTFVYDYDNAYSYRQPLIDETTGRQEEVTDKGVAVDWAWVNESESFDDKIIGKYDTSTETWSYEGDRVGDFATGVKPEYHGYLSSVYFGGAGEIDVYDSDNDGKPDYLFVKEFTTGVIDTEEDGTVENTYDNTKPAEDVDAKIFTDKSLVEGAEFEDGDIVVAYVNENANYVKVIEVVEGKEASITTATDEYMILSTGEKVFFEHAVVAVENGAANELDQLFNNIDFTSDATYYFTADGKLVYTKGLNNGVNVNADYVVVLDKDVKTNSGLVDGEFVEDKYVKIYHDGAIKYVKAKRVIKPDPGKSNGVYDIDHTPETYDKGTATVAGAWRDYSSYEGKLAIAKSDKDGYYYFKLVNPISGYYTPTADELAKNPALTAADKMENAILALADKTDKEDEKNEFRAEKVSSKFSQKSGYLYTLSHITDESQKLVNATKTDNLINGVYVKPYTKIIIKSTDKEGKEIVELYGYDNLPDIDENTVFSNVSYILLNNINSKMYENLVVFYGEISAELEGSKGEVADIRVVKSSSFSYNEEGIIHYYDVYNPFDGKLETGLESVEVSADKSTCYAEGAIVGLTTEKYIDNKTGLNNAGNAYEPGVIYDTEILDFENDIVNGTNKLGYKLVADYDDVTKFLEIAGDKNVYQITDKSVVTFSDKDDDASFKVVDAEVLGSTSKTYRHKENRNNALRVFLCVERNEENKKEKNPDFKLYDIVFAMIVRGGDK